VARWARRVLPTSDLQPRVRLDDNRLPSPDLPLTALDATPDAHRPPWRRRRTRLLTLAVFLGVLLYVARDALVLAPALRWWAATVARDSGLALRFDELRSTGFHRVQFTGLTVDDEGQHPPRLAGELDRLVLDVDPWGLLRGDLGALRRIELEGGRIQADVPRLAALVAPSESGEEPRRAGGRWLDTLPEIQVSALDLDLPTTDGWRARLDGVEVRTEHGAMSLALELAAARVRVQDRRGERWHEQQVSLSGVLEPRRAALNQLGLGGALRAVDLQFELPEDPDRAPSLRGTWPLADGALDFEGRLDPARPSLRVTLRTADLAAAVARELPLIESWFGLDAEWGEPLRGLEGQLTAAVETTAGDALAFDFAGRGLRWNPESALRFEAQGRGSLRAGTLEIAQLTLGEGPNSVTVTDGELPWPLPPWEHLLSRAEGRLAAHLEPGGALWEHLDLPSPLAGAPFELDLQGAVDSESSRLRFADSRLQLPGAVLELHSISLGFPADDPRPHYAVEGTLQVEAAATLLASLPPGPGDRPWLSAGRGPVQLTLAGVGGDFDLWSELDLASVELLGQGLDHLRLDAHLSRSEAGDLHLELLEAAALRGSDELRGSATLHADRGEWAAAQWQSIDALGHWEDLRQAWPAGPAVGLDLSLVGAGPLESPRLWAGLRWRSLDSTSAGAGGAVLVLDGGRVTAEQIDLELGPADLAARGSWAWPPEPEEGLALQLDSLRLVHPATELALEAPVTVRLAEDGWPTATRLALRGSGGALDLVAEEPRSLRLTVTELDWTQWLPAPAPQGLPAAPWSGALTLNADAGRLSLAGSLESGPSQWSAAQLLPGAQVSSEGSRIEVDLTWAGTRRAPLLGRVAVDLRDLRTRGWWPADGELGGGSAALALTFAEQRTALEGVALELPERLSAVGSGWIDAPFLPAEPQALAAADLHWAGPVTIHSLAPVAALLPGLRLLEGRLAAPEFRMGGTLAEWTVEGHGQLEGASVRFTGWDETLRQLSGPFRLRGTGVELGPWTGEIGAAPVQLQGQVDWAGAGGVDLRLGGQNALVYREAELTLRGNLDLRLSGDFARLRLGGGVEFTNSRYTRNLQYLALTPGARRPAAETAGAPLFRLRESPWSELEFDVRITSAPGDPFTVSTNVVRGTLRPELVLSGTGEQPELVGTVFVDPTYVDLPATRLRFPRGTIRFTREAPGRPELELRGETRMRGYDVSVAVTGPLDDPDVLVTTVPPLSNSDAVVLLATGQLPEVALTRSGGVQTAQMLAVYLAKDLGGQLFGGAGEDEDSLLDRFEASVGRDVSSGGKETVEVSFRLLEGLWVRDDRLFLTVERDVYEDVNGGLRLLFRFD
jgi:hypothetical protein